MTAYQFIVTILIILTPTIISLMNENKSNGKKNGFFESEVVKYYELGDNSILNNTTINSIKFDFRKILYSNEKKSKDFFYEACIGKIFIFCNINNKKMVVKKELVGCSISSNYKADNLIVEYSFPNSYTIVFSQYSKNGGIISSKVYKKIDFSTFLRSDSEYNNITDNILLFYQIMDASGLNNLIEKVIGKNNKNSNKYFETISNNPTENAIIITQSNDSEENNITEVNLENYEKSSEKPLMKESYNSSTRDSSFRLYYENNAIKSTGTYKNGKLDGLYMEYHSNGRVKIDGHYENGDKKGLWKFFTDSGRLEREENY